MRWEQTITLIQVLEAYIENISLSLVTEEKPDEKAAAVKAAKSGIFNSYQW